MIIKTMAGIGDAVYTYPIIKHFLKTNKVKVITKHPIIFDSLDVEISTDYQNKFDLNPRYTHLRDSQNNQYTDMLQSVNLFDIPFVLDWKMGFTKSFKTKTLNDLMTKFTQSKKKLCILKEPVCSHMHKKKKDFSISPVVSEIQNFVNSNNYFYISVGNSEIFKKRLYGIDYDLIDKTSIQDLITLCAMSDLIVSQVGHLVPIAQSMNKKLQIFYPEKITDNKLKNINKRKIEL